MKPSKNHKIHVGDVVTRTNGGTRSYEVLCIDDGWAFLKALDQSPPPYVANLVSELQHVA